MIDVIDINRALARNERWLTRLHWLGGFGKFAVCLALVECFVELLILLVAPRWVPAMMMRIYWPLLLLGGGGIGSMILFGVPLTLYRCRLIRLRTEALLAKAYPPGCTCIRGALTDNPSCPHHRDGGLL